MNSFVRQSIILTAAFAMLSGLPLHAEAPPDNARAATGRDFEGQKFHKLGSLNADLLCERLFDSADPASMTFELVKIVGPGILLNKFPEIGGQPTAAQKKTYDDLRVLARQKVWLPVGAERKIGEWLDQKYRKESMLVDVPGLPRNLRARFDTTKALLDGIVGTLPADNPFPFTLAVTQSDASNASVSPGGYMYITTGMLQDKTLDRNDLALRLSHEVAHITRRHALKELQIKIIDALEISKGIKPLIDLAQDPARAMQEIFGTAKATALMFQRFDQVQELEADACGAYLLVRQTGVDAKVAIKRFSASRAGTSRGNSWESSHPAPEEREIVMSAQLDPANRARVAQVSTGSAPSSVSEGGKSSTLAPQTTRSDANLNTLPPTAAGVQPPASANPLGSLFDKIKRSLPVAASSAESTPPRESQ